MGLFHICCMRAIAQFVMILRSPVLVQIQICSALVGCLDGLLTAEVAQLLCCFFYLLFGYRVTSLDFSETKFIENAKFFFRDGKNLELLSVNTFFRWLVYCHFRNSGRKQYNYTIKAWIKDIFICTKNRNCIHIKSEGILHEFILNFDIPIDEDTSFSLQPYIRSVISPFSVKNFTTSPKSADNITIFLLNQQLRHGCTNCQGFWGQAKLSWSSTW